MDGAEMEVWRVEDGDGHGQVWGKFLPETLAHHLLVSTQFLGPIKGRSLSRCCGIEHHPNFTFLGSGFSSCS